MPGASPPDRVRRDAEFGDRGCRVRHRARSCAVGRSGQAPLRLAPVHLLRAGEPRGSPEFVGQAVTLGVSVSCPLEADDGVEARWWIHGVLLSRGLASWFGCGGEAGLGPWPRRWRRSGRVGSDRSFRDGPPDAPGPRKGTTRRRRRWPDAGRGPTSMTCRHRPACPLPRRGGGVGPGVTRWCAPSGGGRDDAAHRWWREIPSDEIGAGTGGTDHVVPDASHDHRFLLSIGLTATLLVAIGVEHPRSGLVIRTVPDTSAAVARITGRQR